jgi:transcriptional regulator with XRE-family HTH domain
MPYSSTPYFEAINNPGIHYGVMPQKPRFKLAPLNLGNETLGERLTRVRKARGLTQTELGERVGIKQHLVSAYERDRLRLSAEMAIRFAQALRVGTDELLGLKAAKGNGEGRLRLKLTKRMQRIERAPASEQQALLKTIDRFLKAAEK